MCAQQIQRVSIRVMSVCLHGNIFHFLASNFILQKKIERKEGKRQREFFKQKKVREVEIDVAERTKRRKLRITNFRSFLAKKKTSRRSHHVWLL